MSLTIGDFARLGGVSARMLRHYDGLGLLRPSRVDESSGYRYYEAAQLARLNRLVALKEVGFSLDEIGRLIDADPSDVHEQLVRRREELARSIESDQRRLVAVDARINLLDDDHPDLAFVEKSLPRVRLMQLTGEVEDAATLGEHIGPMFGRLTGLLAADGVPAPMPSYAWYDSSSALMRFGVGYQTSLPDPVPGAEIADMPAFPRAMSAVHHGEITRIAGAWQALAREVDERRLRVAGPGREVYHECPMDRPSEWVVELQLPTA